MNHQTNYKMLPFNLNMLEECIDLYIDVFSKDPWLEDNNRADVERFFRNFYENNKFIGYVLMDKKQIIAVSVGMLKPWINGEEYYIDQYYVDDRLQGQGIGSYFLEEIKKDLITRGIHAIMLATEKQFPAYRFYTKNGFTCMEDLCFLGLGF